MGALDATFLDLAPASDAGAGRDRVAAQARRLAFGAADQVAHAVVLEQRTARFGLDAFAQPLEAVVDVAARRAHRDARVGAAAGHAQRHAETVAGDGDERGPTSAFAKND